MPRFIEPITIWRAGGTDRYGQPSFTAPETVTGRWEDTAQFFNGVDGKQFVSRAVIFLPKRAYTGDYFFRGESTDSSPPDDAAEAKSHAIIRNVSGTKEEVKVVL